MDRCLKEYIHLHFKTHHWLIWIQIYSYETFWALWMKFNWKRAGSVAMKFVPAEYVLVPHTGTLKFFTPVKTQLVAQQPLKSSWSFRVLFKASLVVVTRDRSCCGFTFSCFDLSGQAGQKYSWINNPYTFTWAPYSFTVIPPFPTQYTERRSSLNLLHFNVYIDLTQSNCDCWSKLNKQIARCFTGL